jgi:hypothetical protein
MKPNLRLAALIVIAVIVLIGLAHTALAAGNCGERKAVEAELVAKFGERPQSTGVLPSGAVMTIWANPATGTWTAVIVTTSGMACIPAAGDTAFGPAGV